MTSSLHDGQDLWRPSRSVTERANVSRLMRRLDVDSYDELLRVSVSDVGVFWDAVVRDLEISWLEPYEQVLDTSEGIEWARWFVGGRLNVAHACVDVWADRTPDASAVVWESESGEVEMWTFARLQHETDRVARGLLRLGVATGDTVGIFLPMVPETVAAVMGCSKIGATWVPVFSGFGVDAVATRLADAGARVLITADGTNRKGSWFDIETVAKAAARSASITQVICLRRGVGGTRVDGGGSMDWDEAFPEPEPGTEPLGATAVDAEHPLFLGYTSGTTGTPKGAVHVHGGFLVKIAEEVAYQTDLHRGERLHWVTDLGWIMGPWAIVGSLALGATVVLAEGVPTFPGPDRLWSTVARHRVDVLGVSPTLIRSLIPHGSDPVREHDLSSLKILASTGEPWNPDAYRWLFETVGEGRLPIINISGGTEVGACFLSPTPLSTLRSCSLGGPALGMDMDIVDPDGEPVAPFDVGELVCRQPWPSMTRGIWGDRDRYLETYWTRFPGVWTHGDWASRDTDGNWFLHGRSDDTLSVAGKRIGPAEVEAAVATNDAVLESAAIGVPDPIKGEQVWCFVALRPSATASDDLARALQAAVVTGVGAPFKPTRVVFVPAIPKTRSGKLVRRTLRAVATGSSSVDTAALEDPAILADIARVLEAEMTAEEA